MERAFPSPPDFDRVARWYPWAEKVCAGGLMARARRAFLGETAQARSLLLIGEGPGRFLNDLLRSGCPARITVVDSSERMLARARRVCHRAGRRVDSVTWVRGDVREVDLPKRCFDGVVTHFFLDCLEERELTRLVSRVRDCAMPGALWAVTDFRIPSGPMACPGRALVFLLYAAFRTATGLETRRLVDPDPMITEAGWKRAARRCFAAGLLRSDLYRLASPGGDSGSDLQ